ncbi:CDP-glucose 4,6-dehydratase [Polynucleobacter paneuropaeus]|jgi:CDP-glucose 4,6-dehydratase|nr:CDP-glucose 4,6-dehydratase [Polynucleobacter paneuropaeus]MBT8576702.1 CDP-glucose 4,6-dehydratase [Polynucleobacter paneuropaeus]MBT8615095.1 CDP-glucose 4,6-dehydratase [Polynucleobacter paneuropaeus]MBT8616576.1 CDP-glucose 4,6-dehydratase [Polynucleobacter paneuropaeus]MBT8618457.1 CDP-glucose 4,6-dehydratase [Polynucleobacter paneuropaeus]
MSFNNIFENKTVLITGHTGFKGSWLTAWLLSLGAKVVGVSLDPPTTPSHFSEAALGGGLVKDLRIDVRNQKMLIEALVEAQPDFVFHMAAQALVKKSYLDPLETWEVNVIGTLNILEALRNLKKKCVAIMITSDKCYDNIEWVWGYRETDTLGGPDPYSASKGAAELVIKSQIKSFFQDDSSNVLIAVARAGNVIGGGDWAQDRIVPDCVKAWALNQTVELRNPLSTRPWQHVLEPLGGYLSLAASLEKNSKLHGEVFNFGPRAIHNHSVLDLVKEIGKFWNQVSWLDVSNQDMGPYESALLKLNCDKALFYLDWHAVMDFEDTVRMTAQWYKNFYQGDGSILEFTKRQISEYVNLAKEKQLTWAQ